MKIQQQLCERLYELFPKKVPVALPLPVKYDGIMYFFGKGEDGGDEIVADIDMTDGFAEGFRIRGWGRIQYLKEEGKTPEEIQDEVAYYIQDAINDYSKFTLSDVLMAIKDFAIVKLYSEGLSIESHGKVFMWKLSKTADEQSDEVCEFLLDILK